jgi:hypothetical protein
MSVLVEHSKCCTVHLHIDVLSININMEHASVNLCKLYSVNPGKCFLLHPKFKIYSKPFNLHLVACTYPYVSSNLLRCDGCRATPDRRTPCRDAALQQDTLSHPSTRPLPRLRRCPFLVLYHLCNIELCICLLGWSSPRLESCRTLRALARTALFV